MTERQMLDQITGALEDMGVLSRGDRVMISLVENSVNLDIRGKFTTMSLHALLALLHTVQTAHGEKVI